jgi:hypothetical protein
MNLKVLTLKGAICGAFVGFIATLCISYVIAAAETNWVLQLVYAQTAFSITQKQILACDQSGYPSCYGIGYSNGLLNTRMSCSTMLLNSSANPSQINNYCLGYNVAAQHMLQQQLMLVHQLR